MEIFRNSSLQQGERIYARGCLYQLEAEVSLKKRRGYEN
jgi:hypothetical protein